MKAKRARTYTEEQRAASRGRAKAWQLANPERYKASRRCPEYKARKNARQREKYAADPDAFLVKSRAYKDAHREAINARNRARYAARADVSRANSRAWRRKNPERVKAHWDRWHAENPSTPEYEQARWNRRRARLLDQRSTGVSEAEWDCIVDMFGGACAYCLRTDTRLTRDHVQPLAAGGLDVPDNVVPACLSCNSSKRDQALPMWLLRRVA